MCHIGAMVTHPIEYVSHLYEWELLRMGYTFDGTTNRDWSVWWTLYQPEGWYIRRLSFDGCPIVTTSSARRHTGWTTATGADSKPPYPGILRDSQIWSHRTIPDYIVKDSERPYDGLYDRVWFIVAVVIVIRGARASRCIHSTILLQ